MCTIALLVDIAPGARLVIAANRDELYARAARPPERIARFARAGDVVAGGVDELSGGTWLAVTRAGRFAAVTNQRALAPAVPTVRSRGLVVGELAAAPDMDAYVRALDPAHYASMNLVWAEPGRAPRVAYLRHDAQTNEVRELPRGIHVLCNDTLGSQGFPRGDRLAARLAAVMAAFECEPGSSEDAPHLDTVIAALPTLLGDHARVPLADVPPSHLPPELARELTCACIHSPAYGTRSSTILAFAPGDGPPLAYLHADGTPCVTAFVDQRGLLA